MPRFPQGVAMCFACLIWLVGVLCPAEVQAHKLSVYAFAEGDRIVGEAYFRSGARPKGASVKVFGPDGKLLAETTTNAKGEFSFALPARVDLKITVDAGEGHAGCFVLKKDELSAELSSAATKEPEEAPTSSNEAQVAGVEYVRPDDVKKIVRQAVSEAVTPLRKELARLQQKGPGVTEILGGIGYIFGLFGVAAYLSARKLLAERRRTDESS